MKKAKKYLYRSDCNQYRPEIPMRLLAACLPVGRVRQGFGTGDEKNMGIVPMFLFVFLSQLVGARHLIIELSNIILFV